MSSSNNRFGRRTGRQNDDLRFEPSYRSIPSAAARATRKARPRRQAIANPKPGPASSARTPKNSASVSVDGKNDPLPSFMRGPGPGPRIEREDAEEFGMSRDDDFDPAARREKAMEPRVTASERTLYHHLFDEGESPPRLRLDRCAWLGRRRRDRRRLCLVQFHGAPGTGQSVRAAGLCHAGQHPATRRRSSQRPMPARERISIAALAARRDAADTDRSTAGERPYRRRAAAEERPA